MTLPQSKERALNGIQLERVLSDGKLHCLNCGTDIAKGALVLKVRFEAAWIMYLHQRCELTLTAKLLNNYAKRLQKKKAPALLPKEEEVQSAARNIAIG